MEQPDFKRVSVIGLGYIGLPTAAMLASKKLQVVGVDVNQHTVDTINRGEVHIVEPDLDSAVRRAVKQGHLTATTTPEPADAFLIAVPTPFKGENNIPDLRFIEAAARSIAPVLEVGNLVILESTSPVGATEAMADVLAEARPDLTFPQASGGASDIRIAHCPERVLPGKVMQELVTNDRVIGGMTAKCSELAANLYKTFVDGNCVETTARVAEMSKLTENSFRDVNIAFANELSIICDKLDIDVWEVIALANRHPRVNILQPGPGVGGHCIAVDPWFIVASARNEARLIRCSRGVNDSKPSWVLDKVVAAVAKVDKPSVTVACFGLAFKPDIDDLRESPALEICSALGEVEGFEVLAVEPHISELPPSLNRKHVQLTGTQEALDSADIIVGLVAHSVFRDIEPRLIRNKQVIDTCAIWY